MISMDARQKVAYNADLSGNLGQYGILGGEGRAI